MSAPRFELPDERSGRAAQGHQVPVAADVRRVTAVTDPVLRNLQITECYVRLSAAMAQRVGACANWCTFAAWASRQAGSTIRGEDLLARLRRRLGTRARLLRPIESLWRRLVRKGAFEPTTRLGRLVRAIHSPFDAFERASDAVARGNLKVFAEIGLLFARYLEEVPTDAADDSPAWRAFEASLKTGEPPDGQRLLRQAFARYERARDQHDPRRRAQTILLANLEIGLHEQTRLQPEILEALASPLVTAHDLGRRVLAVLFPPLLRAPWPVRRPAERLVELPARRLQRFAVRLTRQVITEAAMVLTLPGRPPLSLAAHLDAPWPDSLATIDDEALLAFLREIEPGPAGRDDCGARDWGDLRERLHYIAHLFRALHEDAALRGTPFTPEQVAALTKGVVPDGSL